jgi:hypothetical protein
MMDAGSMPARRLATDAGGGGEQPEQRRAVRATEAFHDHAPEMPFENARHFVLTFHDSTVEAITRNVRIVGSYDTRAEAVRRMTMLAGLG